MIQNILPKPKLCSMCGMVHDSFSVRRYKCKICGKQYKICLFCVMRKVKCSCGGELESAFSLIDLFPFPW